MDPNATLDELTRAVDARDWPTVRERAEALLRWLDRGGFAPAGFSRPREFCLDMIRFANAKDSP